MSTEYKRFKVHNSYRYMKAGSGFISVKDVPQSVIDSFTDDKPVVSDKKCVFCGEVSKLTRIVNLQTVYLCDKDYYDKSIGKIAQKLQENDQRTKTI